MKRLKSSAKLVESSDSDEDKKKVKNKTTVSKPATKTSTFKSSFLSLEQSMNDTTVQVFKNDKFLCIKDKFPKSTIHLLLIPIAPKLLKVEQLIQLPNSVTFLRQFKETADEIIKLNDFKLNFIIGFHAVQSMQPLHMHIISDDFKSDCLKNKKHWNSFTSPYFVKLNDLIEHLESESDYFKCDKFNLKNRAKLDEYLKLDLKCHKCGKSCNNIPNLKAHLKTH